MQGRTDTATFIQAFSGSHRFVLDYLVEEVLQQQPEDVQTFCLYIDPYLAAARCVTLFLILLLVPVGTLAYLNVPTVYYPFG